MFGWFKKSPSKQESAAGSTVRQQKPGELFPWPKGWRLTALTEVVLAIPAAVVPDREVHGNVIHCDSAVKVDLPTESHSTPGAVIMLWLLAGQSVWLTKSCQAMVVPQSAGDTKVRRFALTEVSEG